MKVSLPAPPDFSFVETLSAHGWRCLLPFVWDEDSADIWSASEEMCRRETSSCCGFVRADGAG